jgi:hypothetical protein
LTGIKKDYYINQTRTQEIGLYKPWEAAYPNGQEF